MRPDVSAFNSHDSEKLPRRQVNSRQSGFNLPFSNDFQTLLTFAEAYSALGYSVIPLLGDLDPSRPKVPAVPWSGFQQCRASHDDHRQWFTEAGFGGLGIITGHISQLVVLDFDSQEVFTDFKTRYPDLLETHTVRSAGRQLPHLYFKLPTSLHISSIKGQGADLLSDGCYVVAPPTSINGQCYKITRGGMPKILTERDVRRLQSFLASLKSYSKLPSHTEQKPIPMLPDVQILSIKPTERDLERLYRYHCQRGGRNEALFRTSLYARDTGWSESETQSCLVHLHTQQPTHTNHITEKPARREIEAQKTIRSAFSRPARPTKPAPRLGTAQLSNSVREALIQCGMTYFVRTYDGLLHTGVRPGQSISAQQAVASLKGLVGRDSVLNALRAKQGNQPLFSPVSPHYAVASDNPQQLSKTAYLIESKNQEKPIGGRPATYYQMPSNADLCRLLRVPMTTSDHLQPDDIASARKTRMGLHRELIKRRPGQYPRRWLARRLGITKRTLDAYNRQIPIHRRIMYLETRITWKTIEQLPFDEPLSGAFLESDYGKKYPALRTIAARLLAEGKGICLKQQTASFYWYGDEEPTLKRIHLQQAVVIQQERIQAFIAHQPLDQRPRLVSPPIKPVTHTKKPVSSQNFHKPLKDNIREAQAQTLYHHLNQISTKQLSLANARRLVARYDSQALAVALDRLKTFKTLTNPVGLLVTLLRAP